jgi:hypothetical protein
MQYLVAALYAVQALFVGSLPFWYIRWMTQWADSMNQQNQRLNPGGPAPPPDLLANLDREMTVAFYVAVVVLFAICVLALIGALTRLMSAFYFILGLLCLETLYLGFGAVDSILTSAVSSVFLGQSIGPPAWIAWAQVGFAIPSAALFVWMLIATIRRGPWAMRNVNLARPAPAGKVQPA